MANRGHSIKSYFKRATSPLAVLRLLRDRTMYTYEISQTMKQKSSGSFSVETLYPVLYRLEEQGYVTMVRTEVINNRVRNYYAITEKGRQYLSRSLQAYQELHHAFMSIIEAGAI